MDRRLERLDIRGALSAVADLALPRVCLVCGAQLLPEEKHLCVCCLGDLPLTRFENLDRNPMADKLNALLDEDPFAPYSCASALYYYREGSGYDRISQELKYRRGFSCGKYFSALLGARLASSKLYSDVDLVIPVPLHPLRRIKRGYNQAEVIGKELAAALGAAMRTDILKRVRRTHTQTTLDSEHKLLNVQGAFKACGAKGSLDGARHILLVDDVFTTGSTLSSCHKALRGAAGAQVRISVATLGFVGD